MKHPKKSTTPIGRSSDERSHGGRANSPIDDAAAMRMSRRIFLKNTSLASASLMVGARAFGQVSVPPTPVPRHTVLYIFLRGAADGLSLCVPWSDPDYPIRRTSPDTFVTVDNAHKLTSKWGISTAMDPLMTAWNNGDLALVPASGINYNSIAEKERSHFTAMDRVEYGIDPALPIGSLTSGWAARQINNVHFSTEPPLRGMMLQNLATKTFAQAEKSLAVPDASDFSFPGTDPLMKPAAEAMYANSTNPQSMAAGANTYNAFGYLASATYRTGLAGYPDTPFGAALRRLADIILTTFNPPEIAQIDLGGWDHHNNQGASGGQMWDLMEELSIALAAFYNDLAATSPHNNQPWRNSVTTLCMTEFGRRVQENGSNGTDHGAGGCMIVMGGSQVNGGLVYDGGWTTLAAATDTDEDVKVLTDHRAVIGSCLLKKMQLGNIQTVYPNYNNYVDPGIFV